MLTNRIKHLILLIIVFSLLASIGLAVLIYLRSDELPTDEIRYARESLAASREVRADIYAPALYIKAVSMYDSAMMVWQIENQKWLLRRKFSEVIRLADTSAALAAEARHSAIILSKDANSTSASRLRDVESRIARFEKVYVSLPLSEVLRNDFSRIKLMAEEIRIARSRQQFKKAIELLDTISMLMRKTETAADRVVVDYFENFEAWEMLVKSEIERSKANGKALLVVDKLSGKLLVYKNGKVKHTFPAEFGSNWLGDKLHQGDKATPEGSYNVTRKKERGNTIYYKALLLNYPNAEDLTRYQKNVSNGLIPAGIGAGNLIEIHGHGGRGYHWTDGCIALADRDMDVVYGLSGLQTRVVVVGSTISYEEWYQNRLLDSTTY